MRSRSRRRVALSIALAGALLAGSGAARADQPAAGAPADPTVAVVTGDKVNLRVGPRVDDAEVQQLEQGTVLIIVERAGEWVGVQVPAGFSGAVHSQFLEAVDGEHVKVVGTDVNLRRGAGTDFPAFRDRLPKGAVLPVLAREGDWVWVEAPEEIRAYVNVKYVKEVGPLGANVERVTAGREARAAREKIRNASVAHARTDGDDAALRQELGAVSKGLIDLRAQGGYDVAPVAALEDRLDAAIAARAGASERTRALAKVLLEDLRRETEIRVAFADEILAKKRTGQPAPTAGKPPAEKKDGVEVVGVVRWETAPGWDGGGAFVLWVEDKPAHALRWSAGDLKAFATDKPVKVRGRQLGGRLLGLPTLEVDSIGAP